MPLFHKEYKTKQFVCLITNDKFDDYDDAVESVIDHICYDNYIVLNEKTHRNVWECEVTRKIYSSEAEAELSESIGRIRQASQHPLQTRLKKFVELQ